MGDNRCSGLYSSVGEFLASRGIGAVMPNYRLAPWVKHPDHVQDVARALAWTHALVKEGCDANLRRIDGRNHNSIMFLAITETDPVGGAMVEFIRKRCESPRWPIF